VWDTAKRRFFVRQYRFVLELDGGVVLTETRGHLEKIFRVTRTAAGTDRRRGYPLDSLQCLKR